MKAECEVLMVKQAEWSFDLTSAEIAGYEAAVDKREYMRALVSESFWCDSPLGDEELTRVNWILYDDNGELVA